MAREDSSVEFVDGDDAPDAADDPAQAPRRPSRRVVAAVAAGAAVLGVLAAGAFGRQDSPTPVGPAPPSRPGSVFTATTSPQRPVVVTRLGSPLLGVHGAEDLFARGPGYVTRFELSRGVVTRTAVPMLNSSGPVSLVPLSSQVLVRPMDRVPGFVVPDGRPAREAPGLLALTGPAWPAGQGRNVWLNVGERIVLVDLRGRRHNVTIPVPPGASPLSAWPDGRGGLLFDSQHGWYANEPQRTARLTRSTVVAVGPSGFLISDCRATGCRQVLIDRRSGRRTEVGPARRPVGLPGIIAPDGSAAARIDPRSGRLILTALPTGTERTLPIRPGQDAQSLAWDSEGRWLFVADSAGHLRAVDPDRLRSVDLTGLVGGGEVRQVAVRPGG